jgi:hypothetical protein
VAKNKLLVGKPFKIKGMETCDKKNLNVAKFCDLPKWFMFPFPKLRTKPALQIWLILCRKIPGNHTWPPMRNPIKIVTLICQKKCQSTGNFKTKEAPLVITSRSVRS